MLFFFALFDFNFFTFTAEKYFFCSVVTENYAEQLQTLHFKIKHCDAQCKQLQLSENLNKRSRGTVFVVKIKHSMDTLLEV